jgi:CO/xanthine dehydrogenase FAD-binding subunit
MQHRIEASQRRTNVKDWKAERRQRTRHLIELGGLAQKAGLVELTNDDRAVLFGAFLRLADIFREENAETTVALCRRRGKRGFENAVCPDNCE